MAKNVKITTENSLIDIICPHYCRGCGALGSVLCERCKNYIKRECVGDVVEKTTDLMVVGRRVGLLRQLIVDYKYRPVRGLGKALAGLLDEAIPWSLSGSSASGAVGSSSGLSSGSEVSGPVVVVPLPTIGKHVRERGFDHMELIARHLARRRGWKKVSLLARANSSVQVGADEETRKRQAEGAYEMVGDVEPDARYLLVDDVWTTGASMMAAEKVLRQAGAVNVYKAVIAKNR